MKEQSIEILKTLTEASGVSGFEVPIRKIISDYLSPLSSEILSDNIGSLIACKQSANKYPKIMLVSHMKRKLVIILVLLVWMIIIMQLNLYWNLSRS